MKVKRVRSDVALFMASLLFFTIMLTITCAHAAEQQYVQIVSYSGRRVMFAAKPFETHVMTYNCTVEMFVCGRENSSYIITCDGEELKRGSFLGWKYSVDIILPQKRKVKLVVTLNGQEFWFDLLLTKRTPEPEELEAITTIELTPEELLSREWRAWGGAVVGGMILAIPAALLVAKRIRAVKGVEEL